MHTNQFVRRDEALLMVCQFCGSTALPSCLRRVGQQAVSSEAERPEGSVLQQGFAQALGSVVADVVAVQRLPHEATKIRHRRALQYAL